MFIASDLATFQSSFVTQLKSMLSADELGAFILVLANSMQDDNSHTVLRDELQVVFNKHRARLNAGMLQAAPDDEQVFRSLTATGIDEYATWRRHNKGDWIQFYNPLRALRPARVSNEKTDGLFRVFDNERFHFNKAFLKPEIFWNGKVAGATSSFDVTVLYNKFPFLPYHFLLVPESKQCHPQYLMQNFHQMIWTLCLDTSTELSGIGFGYNSIGACASVNQLHFQGFLLEQTLPVELNKWQHNGGASAYPMRCEAFTDAESCWQAIQRNHDSGTPYNLLYRPGRCYLFSRKMQGSAGVNERMQGAGWIEACGVFSEASKDAFDSMSAEELAADIASLSI